AALPVADEPLRQHEVILAAILAWSTRSHDAVVALGDLPRTGWILDPHRADQAVAVDVLRLQTVPCGVGQVVRKRTSDGALGSAAGQELLAAIDGDAWDDVERCLIQQPS